MYVQGVRLTVIHSPCGLLSEIEGSLAFCALMLFLCSILRLMCSGSSLHVECILPYVCLRGD